MCCGKLLGNLHRGVTGSNFCFERIALVVVQRLDYVEGRLGAGRPVRIQLK